MPRIGGGEILIGAVVLPVREIAKLSSAEAARDTC
jgi:hypothetical protein